MRKRICDHAIDVLHETDNPAVMWGDTGLLHAIAERVGLPHEGPRTERRILDALSKTPGRLVPRITSTRRVGDVRIFLLPEEHALREEERRNV